MQTKKVSPELFIRSNSELFSKMTTDGILLLSPDEKFLYILKGAATLIWDKADGKRTVKEISESISQECEIDLGTVERDLVSFLKESSRGSPPLFLLSMNPAE